MGKGAPQGRPFSLVARGSLRCGGRRFQEFDAGRMAAEQPTCVPFNGAMRAKTGEIARVFMVCGGLNLASSFHLAGNVWSRAWPQIVVSGRVAPDIFRAG